MFRTKQDWLSNKHSCDDDEGEMRVVLYVAEKGTVCMRCIDVFVRVWCTRSRLAVACVKSTEHLRGSGDVTRGSVSCS